MTHPAELWKEPVTGPVFEMVRARGMETIHHKRPGEDAALCGLLPADSPRGRWTVYPELPVDAVWCRPCTIMAGNELRKAGLSKADIEAWPGWPYKKSE